MRILTLIITFIWTFTGLANAQCDLTLLQPLNAPGQELIADEECTDAQGWTHYYHTPSNRILLSIRKNGQNIGSIDLGLTVKAGTLPTFNNGAFNLSGADYIDNEIWVVANRYWQVTGATAIAAPVQVRFYFSNTDITDIAASVDDFGYVVDEAKDLYVYTIGNGGGLSPYATSTQPFNGVYTLYDTFVGGPPEWTEGSFNGYPLAEFTIQTLDIGGSIGFLIFQSAPPLTISGNIARPNGDPVPDVTVQSASISVDVTGADGNYTNGSLLSGSDYEVVPFKDINHTEGITVVDLIAIAQHLNGTQPITNPYRLIAANANADTVLTFTDLATIRDVLLGNSADFPNSTSWRFLPANYVFPTPNHPFTPQFPERILANNLQTDLDNQHFIGVKIGDVADPSSATPPALNTTFLLENLNACNPGDTVEFDLSVQDFQNIRGFQFTLEWNANVLDFVSASNFNLINLTNNNVGTSEASNGLLSFVWFNAQQSSGGSSLPNGSVILKLKFIATGSVGSTTPLNFTSTATDLHVVHQNMTQVVPSTTPGSFIIDNNSTITGSAFVQSTGCTFQASGAIDLLALGGTPPLNYLWSNGATTQDIFGLTAGTYTVTITDATGNCPKVLSYEVTPPAALDVTASVTDMACPFVANGSIELHVSGGEAPFSYLWNDGATSRINDNLYEGTYTVTITDGAGCTSTANFDIENWNQIMPVVTVTNASNANKANGSVMMTEINGGTGPFSFLWSNGATTQSLVDILPGDYVVTITDAIGCQHVFGYQVYGLFTATLEAGSNLSGVEIYPNPAWAGDPLALVFSVKTNGKIEAITTTADGKLTSRHQFTVPAGTSRWQMETPTVAGFYIVRLEMGGQPVGWLKLMVQ